MSIEKAAQHLRKWGKDTAILQLDVSTATVQQAADALGVEPGRIAKSISLQCGDGALVLVAAGDARIDNAKYKAQFSSKAKMLTAQEVQQHTGHAVGGVCPFGLPPGVRVYLDRSLLRYSSVFPACGSANSAIELTIPELEEYTGFPEWVEVCRLP